MEASQQTPKNICGAGLANFGIPQLHEQQHDARRIPAKKRGAGLFCQDQWDAQLRLARGSNKIIWDANRDLHLFLDVDLVDFELKQIFLIMMYQSLNDRTFATYKPNDQQMAD